MGRNLALLGLAVFVSTAGWAKPGLSATHWLTQVASAWLVAIGAGLVVVALASFSIWFSLQLLAQNGQTLARLEALESNLRAIAEGRALAPTGPVGITVASPSKVDGPKTVASGAAGLSVGSHAPEFALEDLQGSTVSLESLLAGGLPVMLLFTSARCGPCETMLKSMPGWQERYGDLLRFVVIATGDRKAVQSQASAYDLPTVLLQSAREVSVAYHAHGTPMAVVVGTDGVVLSPTVAGAEQITALVEQAGRSGPLRSLEAASPVGGQSGTARLEPGQPTVPRPGPALGQRAPALNLTDLDGKEVDLAAVYRFPALVACFGTLAAVFASACSLN